MHKEELKPVPGQTKILVSINGHVVMVVVMMIKDLES